MLQVSKAILSSFTLGEHESEFLSLIFVATQCEHSIGFTDNPLQINFAFALAFVQYKLTLSYYLRCIFAD